VEKKKNEDKNEGVWGGKEEALPPHGEKNVAEKKKKKKKKQQRVANTFKGVKTQD